jgi:hypothetical protein
VAIEMQNRHSTRDSVQGSKERLVSSREGNVRATNTRNMNRRKNYLNGFIMLENFEKSLLVENKFTNPR